FIGNIFGCIWGGEGNIIYDNTCVEGWTIPTTVIGIWTWFIMATSLSLVGIFISFGKLIKRRKRKLKSSK
ncbi:MAG: hypothetical protein ACFE9R_02805, partial [Candidatus Hermodarchaeota archaeon]